MLIRSPLSPWGAGGDENGEATDLQGDQMNDNEIRDADMKTLWDRVKDLEDILNCPLKTAVRGANKIELGKCRDRAIYLDNLLDKMIEESETK